MARYDFDLFTIGAGSGGVRGSRMSAQFGARVGIAEESRVGGTCVIRGCVPKKLLVYGAHFAEDIQDAAGYGWTIPESSFDWAKLIAAKNAEIDRLQGVYTRILRDNNVQLFESRAHLIDAHTLEVGGQRVTADNILISVGGWPSLPQIPGIEHAITSNEALDLMQLPKRVAIVGAGFIAVEFAGIFAALGAKVTQIFRGDMVLRGFDQDVRATLEEALAKKGVDLRCETVVRSIEKTANGYNLSLNGDEEIEVDLVMYATGRRPKTDGLGLEHLGVKTDPNSGAILVDEYSKTSVDNIYAIGDCTDRINLTPVAIHEGRFFAETVFRDNPMKMDYENVPAAVFSQPPIGTVGLGETEARARFKEIDVYISRFRPMRNILAGRDERTMMKLVVDRATQRVVGAHMVGPDAPEIIQGIAIAVKCGATKQQFDSTIGIHPTAAEEFVTMRDKRPDPSPETQD